MSPDVGVRPAATYGYLVSCTACGRVGHREAEIDADQLALYHRDTHLRQATEAERAESAVLLARRGFRSVG